MYYINTFIFRWLDPLTRSFAPGPHWGQSSQTPIISSRSALATISPPALPSRSATAYHNDKVRTVEFRTLNGLFVGALIEFMTTETQTFITSKGNLKETFMVLDSRPEKSRPRRGRDVWGEHRDETLGMLSFAVQ